MYYLTSLKEITLTISGEGSIHMKSEEKELIIQNSGN